MPHRPAGHEHRRQTALLLSLSAAVVVSLAFSEYLTRTRLGLAAFWPANALLVAGLITLSGARRLTLSTVFVVCHLVVDLLARYRDRGLVVVVTHDAEMVQSADKILVMRDGRTVDWVAPEEMRTGR